MNDRVQRFGAGIRRGLVRSWHGIAASASTAGMHLTPDMRAIARCKDSLKGRVGFLIGNGPSVRTEDLDALSGRVGFCCNRFYLAYPKLTFRPSFLVSVDRQMIDDFGREMVQLGQCPVWLVDHTRPAIDGKFVWVKSDWRTPFQFHRDVRFGAGGGAATLVAALQIGYHMGIRRFFLYGVDHTFKFQKVATPEAGLKAARGDGNHFIPNYRSGKSWIPPKPELTEEAFRACDALLRSEGGWLKNATRGGALEVVERATFEDALRCPDGL